MHEPPSMHCWPKHLPRASVDGPVALAGTNRQLLFHTAFLDSYGTRLTLDEVIARVGVLIDDQIQLMRQYASVGDATYQRMLEHGRGHDVAGPAKGPTSDGAQSVRKPVRWRYWQPR